MHAMTAAHKSLPLPTYVRVTNLENGRSTVLRVNDRGPFHENRIIDLSYAAARKLDITREGTGMVEVRALTPGWAPAPSVIPVSTASAPPAPAPAVAAASGTVRAPRLYLQAGAFLDRANAESLRTRLASLDGVNAVLQEVTLGGQRLYRVRLGPMSSVEEADRTSASVVQAGMQAPHIVIE
jgi:rare lipoprotein A